MLIIDDILLAPLRGVLWVAEKIRSAAEENLEAQKLSVTAELSELGFDARVRDVLRSERVI